MTNREKTGGEEENSGRLADEEAKVRFFAAAEPLFERLGFRRTTVEEVCRSAKAGKQTFYRLFSGKQDLCIQMVIWVWNRETEEWEAGLPSDATPVEALQSFLNLYAEISRKHPFFWVLVEDLELMRSLGQAMDEIVAAQRTGPLHRILTQGMEEGVFRIHDATLAVWLIFSLLDTVYLLFPRISGEPGPLEDPQLAKEVGQFIVRGLMPEGR